MDNYIREYRNVLTKEFCKQTISKFEGDLRKSPGVSASGFDEGIKRSTDLLITNHLSWENEDSVFRNSLSTPIQKYYGDVIGPCYQSVDNSLDTGYNIQRTEPGQFYDWHNDAHSVRLPEGVFMRIFTFIWYLNDIQKGGETEFRDGTKIQPEAGKLLMFPATWVHTHIGVSPVNETQYIATGWFYTRY